MLANHRIQIINIPDTAMITHRVERPSLGGTPLALTTAELNRRSISAERPGRGTSPPDDRAGDSNVRRPPVDGPPPRSRSGHRTGNAQPGKIERYLDSSLSTADERSSLIPLNFLFLQTAQQVHDSRQVFHVLLKPSLSMDCGNDTR